jgi:hypothetical protein
LPYRFDYSAWADVKLNYHNKSSWDYWQFDDDDGDWRYNYDQRAISIREKWPSKIGDVSTDAICTCRNYAIMMLVGGSLGALSAVWCFYRNWRGFGQHPNVSCLCYNNGPTDWDPALKPDYGTDPLDEERDFQRTRTCCCHLCPCASEQGSLRPERHGDDCDPLCDDDCLNTLCLWPDRRGPETQNNISCCMVALSTVMVVGSFVALGLAIANMIKNSFDRGYGDALIDDTLAQGNWSWYRLAYFLLIPVAVYFGYFLRNCCRYTCNPPKDTRRDLWRAAAHENDDRAVEIATKILGRSRTPAVLDYVEEEKTALQVAILNGKVKLAQKLIENGASVWARSNAERGGGGVLHLLASPDCVPASRSTE